MRCLRTVQFRPPGHLAMAGTSCARLQTVNKWMGICSATEFTENTEKGNPKLEILNSKQIRMTEVQMPET